jgi:hypothetical protein
MLDLILSKKRRTSLFIACSFFAVNVGTVCHAAISDFFCLPTEWGKEEEQTLIDLYEQYGENQLKEIYEGMLDAGFLRLPYECQNRMNRIKRRLGKQYSRPDEKDTECSAKRRMKGRIETSSDEEDRRQPGKRCRKPVKRLSKRAEADT